MTYDASDPKQVKERIKQLKVHETLVDALIQQIMSSREGRAWFYELLDGAHLWRSSFSVDAIVMSFSEGERNIGLKLLAEIMRAAPERYLEMVREADELMKLELLVKRQMGETDGDRTDYSSDIDNILINDPAGSRSRWTD